VLINVHLLVNELYEYQNARCNDKKGFYQRLERKRNLDRQVEESSSISLRNVDNRLPNYMTPFFRTEHKMDLYGHKNL